MTEYFTQTLSILTILGQVSILVLFFAYLNGQEKILKFVSEKSLVFGFIIALVATLGSLTYSEIIGYDPCKLCWLQRIFIYPQTVLLGLALWKKDYSIGVYSLVLSVIGGFIAGYHYLLQVGFAPALSCDSVGYSVSCSQRFVMSYGYITIPMMALTAFMMLAVIMVVHMKYSKNKVNKINNKNYGK